MSIEEIERDFANFSNLQREVWNACLDAAAKKARLYLGGLIPSEKKMIVDMIDKLRTVKVNDQPDRPNGLQDWERFKSDVNIVNNETVTKYYIPESHFDDTIIQKIIPEFREVVVESIYRDEVYGSTGQLIRDKLVVGRSITLYKPI